MIRYEFRFRTKQDFVATCKIFMGEPDAYMGITSACLKEPYIPEDKLQDWANAFLNQNSSFRYLISIEKIEEERKTIYLKFERD